MNKLFSSYSFILASASPRRQELLAGLDIDFTVLVREGIGEAYPDSMALQDVPAFLAQKKALAYTDLLEDPKQVLITADTLVILGDEALGKPCDLLDAKAILTKLSGNTHRVVTGVCISHQDRSHTFSSQTEVQFSHLTEEQIHYYLTNYQPYDKAGAYGVQEWIGYVGVSSMTGSYYNVMGLPVHDLYTALGSFLI